MIKFLVYAGCELALLVLSFLFWFILIPFPQNIKATNYKDLKNFWAMTVIILFGFTFIILSLLFTGYFW